jgi:tetratricopeptide (TPR) repeat protein
MKRALLVATVLMISNLALAQQSDDERARMHFQSGLSYYEQARYADAAREFTEAYTLSQRPALLLNLSQAYERDLKFAEAIAELERYLQVLPDSPQQRTVETRIERLRELQARVAASNPTTPAQPVAEEPAPVEEPAPEPASTVAPTATPERSGSGISVPGLVLVSSGGLLLAGSVVLGIMAHSRHADLQDRCPGGVCPPSEDAQSDIDSGRTLAWVSTGFMAGGIVAAAVGAVLLFTHDGGSESAPTAGMWIGSGQVVGVGSVRF